VINKSDIFVLVNRSSDESGKVIDNSDSSVGRVMNRVKL